MQASAILLTILGTLGITCNLVIVIFIQGHFFHFEFSSNFSFVHCPLKVLVLVVLARHSITDHGLLVHQVGHLNHHHHKHHHQHNCHQAVVDGARSAILLPLGQSILQCQPMSKSVILF